MAAPQPPDRATAPDGARASSRRSPTTGALLSFLWPGLGELYAGSYRRAAIFGLPTLAVAGWLGYLALGGLMQLAFNLFDTGFSSLLFGAIVLTGVLRVASIVDAYRILARARGSRSGSAPLARSRPAHLGPVPVAAALLVVVALMAHGLAGYYTASFYAAGSKIFGDSGSGVAGGDVATPGPSGGATLDPGASTNPFASPAMPPPTTASARINILLLGADSGMGYNHALTDSQIVVSIDPVTKTVVMASLPRDLADLRMYSGGTYSGKINSLMSAATGDRKRYPDGGVGTLAKEIGYLIGIPINYYAFINLAGFGTLVDTVGGVDVVNPKDIVDPGYGFPDGKTGFILSAGPHHLNSRLALAFVRTRMGVGDNDYTRAARQQLVLQALRHQLTTPASITKIPALLDALAQTIQTNFPVSRLSEMLDLAQQIPDSAISKFVLGPPYSVHPAQSATGGVWLLRADMKAFKAWSVKQFGPDSAYYVAPKPTPSG